MKVRLGDLREAAGRLSKMKRVRGARSQVPSTTVLKRDSRGLAVETPFIESYVDGEGKWDCPVEDDAFELLDLLTRLKTGWKTYGGDDALVELSVEPGFLWFSCRGEGVASRQSLRIIRLG
jgi:hypothetical protein